MIQFLTLHDFVSYFESWANEDPEIKFFLYGGIEKGLAFARGHEDFGYPFVWLEQPVIYTSDNGYANTNEEFRFGLSVLLNYQPGNYEGYVEAQSIALSALHRLQKQIRHDVKAGLIEATVNGNKKEAISDLWIDKHTGWRIEMSVEFNANSLLC
ncbi:MAG: hypothetical protein ACK41O_14630 [Runella zeae]